MTNSTIEIPSFNSYIEKTIVNNWDKDALTDYKGETLQYKDVARKIEKLHILFEYGGVKRGDKIALCGRNSAYWATAFLATLTYGAIAVPILHEFKADQIFNIVNHSEAKLLLVGDIVAQTIEAQEMPTLKGIIYIPDYSLLVSRSDQLSEAREKLNELYGHKYPKYFRKEHVHYYKDSAEELALINYTSGTTGHSKGVMLPYRALWSNVSYCFRVLGPHVKAGDSMLSILPMAHMYGLSMEFLFGFCNGCHLSFLTRLPSPAIIAQAFAEVKPVIIISVPLVVEKIIRKKIFPQVQTNLMHLLMNMPVVSRRIKQIVCEKVKEAFGGNTYEVIVGGAALNQEIETFLHNIDFPIAVGYGTTECAPLITFSDWHNFIPGSCGKQVDNMEVKILSDDPQRQLGEIITRGINVMLGYYKNEEATKNAFDNEGWYHTGDLGVMNSDGHVFIKGRIKNMLLGANGQNIYPEEIEDKLNSMAMVNESLVIQRDNKLVALVCPDHDAAKEMGFGEAELHDVMEENRRNLNDTLPAYCKIAQIELHQEEFEKTAKKSIKRYLYR